MEKEISKLSYEQAIEEVENILDKFNNEELSVDSLASEVKRALELIKECKTRLRKTEEELSDILNTHD